MHTTGFLSILLFCPITAFAAPISILDGLTDKLFGVKDSGAQTVSIANVDPLLTPARFARAAYCSTSSVLNLTCGEPCKALGDVEVLFAGGDDKTTPRFYVAHDKSAQTIVVSHQGTNTKSLASLINDIVLTRSPANPDRFKGVSKDASIHDGFNAAFERTADQVINTVKQGLTDKGVKKVAVIGHSLGAAIAMLDAIALKSALGSDVAITTTLFGLPRVGNKEWADFVDATLGDTLTWVSNNQDPVVQVPPREIGFEHPSHQVHIKPGNETIACGGRENSNCSEGNSLFQSSFADHRGPYFTAAIPMGKGSCPGFEDDVFSGFI